MSTPKRSGEKSRHRVDHIWPRKPGCWMKRRGRGGAEHAENLGSANSVPPRPLRFISRTTGFVFSEQWDRISSMTRQQILMAQTWRRGTVLLILASLSADWVGGQTTAAPDRKAIVVTAEAMELHRSALVADGHNDLPWAVRDQGGQSFDNLDISQPQPKLHTDIARLRAGGVAHSSGRYLSRRVLGMMAWPCNKRWNKSRLCTIWCSDIPRRSNWHSPRMTWNGSGRRARSLR